MIDCAPEENVMQKIVSILSLSLAVASTCFAATDRTHCSDANQSISLYAVGMDDFDSATIETFDGSKKTFSLSMLNDSDAQKAGTDAVMGRKKVRVLSKSSAYIGCQQEEKSTFTQAVKIQHNKTKEILFEGQVLCEYYFLSTAGGVCDSDAVAKADSEKEAQEKPFKGYK